MLHPCRHQPPNAEVTPKRRTEMLVTGEMLKPGAIVLDAGLNVVENRLAGDVDFDSAREVAGYLTPAPGGLGPLTNLMLIRHTVVGPS